MIPEIYDRSQVKQPVRREDVRKYEFFVQNSLNPLWVSDYAEYFSVEALAQNKMNITQLRAFFNEFLRIKDLAKETDNIWTIQLKLIEAKAVYRANSSSARIPQEFSTFITKLVDDIGNDYKRFTDACLIMEALVAYYKKPDRPRDNRR